MAKEAERILLPPPNFERKLDVGPTPHFLTPTGMVMLPREKQPPPMYGARGATIPPKFMRPPARGQHKWQRQCQTRQHETPSNNEHEFCDSCDMELHSKEDLRRHCAQHEVCPVDGCKYRGHPTVMDKHVMELHTSGLFDKFKKLSTPEEIAAWRDERRKKYPTVESVQMRQRAQEQRQKRGERLEENKNRFGRREDRRRAFNQSNDCTSGTQPQKRKGQKRQKRKEYLEKKAKRFQPTAPEEVSTTNDSETESCGGVSMFRGTGALKECEHTSSKSNALSNLFNMYGSDTDDDEQKSKCLPEKDTIDVITTNGNEADVPALEENSNVDDGEISSSKQCAIPMPISIPANLAPPIHNDNLKSTEEQDSSDEAPMEMPIMHSCEVPMVVATQPSIDPAATCSSTSLKSNTQRAKVVAKRTQMERRSGLDYRKARLRKQNTMLEKLLEGDIRHERNVLLQCVRFVCENNFFGVGEQHKT